MASAGNKNINAKLSRAKVVKVSMEKRLRNCSKDCLTVNQRNKRAKSSESGGENALPIPIDLIFEIFSRLPVKSIARCRCVSKIWSSMLRRREFIELFSSKSQARPQLLFACQNGSELLVFSSPQPQNPDENSPPIIANYQMSFSFDGDHEISGAVNGLLCVISDKRLSNGRKETVPVLCNPSTGESLPLKKVKTGRDTMRSIFFGYDPIDKGFKVLSMTWALYGIYLVDDYHQVLTLGTNNWRMVECCVPGRYSYRYKELCINGVLYYQTTYSSPGISGICCFDIRTEKFSFIKFNEAIHYATLINYNGNLGLVWSGSADCCFGQRSTNMKLWVLEDFERQEWSKRIIVLPPLWKYVVGQTRLSLVGVTSRNEIVFHDPFVVLPPLYLFYLNIDKNTIVSVEIQGIDRCKYGGICIFMNHLEDVKLI